MSRELEEVISEREAALEALRKRIQIKQDELLALDEEVAAVEQQLSALRTQQLDRSKEAPSTTVRAGLLSRHK